MNRFQTVMLLSLVMLCCAGRCESVRPAKWALEGQFQIYDLSPTSSHYLNSGGPSLTLSHGVDEYLSIGGKIQLNARSTDLYASLRVVATFLSVPLADRFRFGLFVDSGPTSVIFVQTGSNGAFQQAELEFGPSVSASPVVEIQLTKQFGISIQLGEEATFIRGSWIGTSSVRSGIIYMI